MHKNDFFLYIISYFRSITLNSSLNFTQIIFPTRDPCPLVKLSSVLPSPLSITGFYILFDNYKYYRELCSWPWLNLYITSVYQVDRVAVSRVVPLLVCSRPQPLLAGLNYLRDP